MSPRGGVGKDPAVLEPIAYAVSAHGWYYPVMANDPWRSARSRKGVARPVILTILHGTLVRFIFVMLVIFGFYAVIFAWAKATEDSCVEIAQFRGESYYWLQSCLQLREQ